MGIDLLPEPTWTAQVEAILQAQDARLAPLAATIKENLGYFVDPTQAVEMRIRRGERSANGPRMRSSCFAADDLDELALEATRASHGPVDRATAVYFVLNPLPLS